MQLIQANLWDCQGVLCITTNGYTKTNGDAVMGAGVAKQATQRIPGVARNLGKKINTLGNRVARIAGPNTSPYFDRDVVAFPVKHHWKEKADLDLIASSAEQLATMIDNYIGDTLVFLPKPGCGNGGLNWSEVADTLEPYLGIYENLYIVDR